MKEETYLERELAIAESNKNYFKVLLLLKIKLWVLRRKNEKSNDRLY